MSKVGIVFLLDNYNYKRKYCCRCDREKKFYSQNKNNNKKTLPHLYRSPDYQTSLSHLAFRFKRSSILIFKMVAILDFQSERLFDRKRMFFVSKGNLFDVYFTTLQLVLVPCGGGRTSPRTLP